MKPKCPECHTKVHEQSQVYCEQCGAKLDSKRSEINDMVDREWIEKLNAEKPEKHIWDELRTYPKTFRPPLIMSCNKPFPLEAFADRIINPQFPPEKKKPSRFKNWWLGLREKKYWVPKKAKKMSRKELKAISAWPTAWQRVKRWWQQRKEKAEKPVQIKGFDAVIKRELDNVDSLHLTMVDCPPEGLVQYREKKFNIDFTGHVVRWVQANDLYHVDIKAPWRRDD